MIRSIDVRRGMAEGAGIGLLTGVLLGGAAGYAIGDDCSQRALFCIDRADAASGLGITLGVVGGLAGLLAGASSGARDEWMFR